jgi:D-glycero-D-manno-heptose 1,7-bisphosphate phosphatase
MSRRRAIFLDKDGTLVPDIGYNVRPELIELAQGATRALRTLARAGYQLVVVSNQSGVARGLFDEAALLGVSERLGWLLQKAGLKAAGFYYCPHHPDGSAPAYAVECDCRKPKPGLLLRAAADLNISLAQSWMIGDILHDVEAAHRAGCRAVLLVNGGEDQWEMSALRWPDLVAADLETAARQILSFKSPNRTQQLSVCQTSETIV